MNQLADDLESGGDANTDEATVQSDAAQVESAAQALQADPGRYLCGTVSASIGPTVSVLVVTSGVT